MVSDTDGAAFVQLRAYADPDAAEPTAERVRAATDHPVTVGVHERDDGTLHRVRVGPRSTPKPRAKSPNASAAMAED